MSSKSIYTNSYSASNLPYVPYTYVVIHNKSGKKYYGAKYSKNAHPSLFFKHYFTSSKIVKAILEAEGLDAFSFQIRKTFTTSQDCINWEKKVLIRLKVSKNDNWFNIDEKQQIIDNTGKITIYNEITHECIRFPKNLEIPNGWKEGNITTRNLKLTHTNRKWFYNPITNEAFHIDPKFKTEEMLPGRGPNYISNSNTLKGKYHWITNGEQSKQVNKLEPIPEGWRKGFIYDTKSKPKKQKLEPQPKKIRDKRPFKFITDGTITLKYYEGDIFPENFYYKGKHSQPKPHLYPKAPTIFINNGITRIRHPEHIPIPDGWKKGFALEKKIKEPKICNLSVFKNVHSGETRLFSTDYIDINWKKFNDGKFSADRGAPIKGRIAVKNEFGKMKYIKPGDTIPVGFEKIKK